MTEKKRGSFSGSIGFVLAAAGSAVGLGNIWRFPYLAAKDNGGLFIFCYLILVFTFGFTLLITEIAIGRKTKQSPLTAYGKINKKFGFLGSLATLVNICLKRFIQFLTFHVHNRIVNFIIQVIPKFVFYDCSDQISIIFHVYQSPCVKKYLIASQ